jgi:tripartite-type tricarboxylate transporter receptor subunit TctC
MKLSRRQFLHLAAGAAAVSIICVFGQHAWSQTPRTVKVVVPFPPGGNTDILARSLAEQIGGTQRATIVVENRPGAASVIGTEVVARAAPDGSTVLLNAPPFVINPHLRTVNYDALTSFEPICYLAREPLVIVVNSASPYHTLADLLSGARGRPGRLTLASIGPASTFHITFEKLKRDAKVDMTFVPYPGASPAVNALLGEHVTSVFTTYAAVAEQLKAGKLRAIVTASRDRIEPLPNVPTISESGYKEIDADAWSGLVAPAKTPKETVSQLADWFGAALQSPEVRAKLVIQRFYPVEMRGADFSAYIKKQHEEFGRVIREANIKAE